MWERKAKYLSGWALRGKKDHQNLLNNLILKEIGCNLEVGSMVKLDKCGVCGGDGSSCRLSRFGWKREALSECSASCGGGRVVVHFVCKNSQGNKKVDEGFCDKKKKPKSLSMDCNEFPCPAR